MGRGIAPACVGIVVGTALQLQQAALWAGWAYGAVALVGIALLSVRRPVAVLAGPLLLAFALTGLRSAAFLSNALDPALEGRDIEVTGVVAAMPQRNEGG